MLSNCFVAFFRISESDPRHPEFCGHIFLALVERNQISVFQHKKELLPVKLADFGFAKHIARKNGCRTLCGTPGYLAPEILERWPSYDVKCDVWSIGVILFLLLGGYLPFDDENEDKVFDRTRNGQYDFRPQYWRNISSGAKDLVSQCLTINPSKRIDATTALKHDWMAVGEKELSGQVDVDKIKSLMAAKKKMKAALNTVRISLACQNEMPNRFSLSFVATMSYIPPLISSWLQTDCSN